MSYEQQKQLELKQRPVWRAYPNQKAKLRQSTTDSSYKMPSIHKTISAEFEPSNVTRSLSTLQQYAGAEITPQKPPKKASAKQVKHTYSSL